jgi:hypothetical protein
MLFFIVLRIKSRTLCMRGKHSTTELYSSPVYTLEYICISVCICEYIFFFSFFFFVFGDRVSLCSPGCPQYYNPPASDLQSAGITGVYHHAWPQIFKIYFYYYYLFSIWDWTQGLTHANLALYHWAIPLSQINLYFQICSFCLKIKKNTREKDRSIAQW